jgi:hypothetical protein
MIMKQKKQLTRGEEFDILKLVLDKVLLLGFALAGYGIIEMYNTAGEDGFFLIIGGIVFLMIFSFLLVKEYEFIR